MPATYPVPPVRGRTGYVAGMKFTIGFLAGGAIVAAWLRWWRPLAIAWWAQGH